MDGSHIEILNDNERKFIFLLKDRGLLKYISTVIIFTNLSSLSKGVTVPLYIIGNGMVSYKQKQRSTRNLVLLKNK